MSYKSISSNTNTDPKAKTQRKVLLVDDSEIDRKVYQRYLQADSTYHYRFLEAETAEEAFESYARYQPDVILLDYLLPDTNGLEWLSQIQKQQSSLCPAIVLTGQGDENIAVQFIKLGAADYLVKGQMTAEKLRLAIDKAIYAEQLQQTNRNLVSELVARNEKLKRSNQLYREEISKREKLQEILANVPVVIYAKDVDPTTRQTGKLWLVNQEFQKVFAITEENAIGKTDREIFSSFVADNFAVNDRLVIDSQQPLTTEENVYHADGSFHTYLSLKFPLLDEAGQVSSIVGISSNITQNKQAQAKIIASETKFRNTFEQAAVGIAHVALDGQWLRVNQKLCEIVGYTKEELLLTTFQNLTHPDDLDKDLRYVNQMLAGKIQTYSAEKRYICKNKKHIWIELTVSLVRKSDGEPDYFISVIEDISDRKNLEFNLQKSLRRLSNLHKIDKAILAAAKPQAIAQTAIDNIQHIPQCKRASIVTFDWEKKTATVLATQGKGKSIVGNRWKVPLETWQNIIDRLQHNNREENYLVVRLKQSSRLSQLAIALQPLQLECFIAFPIEFKDKLLGILKLWVVDPDVINAGDLVMVEEISSQLAIALQQARLYKQSQNYALELEARVAQRTAQLEDINQQLKAFTYTISHDLKAPLRAIQGFATALEEDYIDLLDGLGQEYISRLVSAAQQMTYLIEDLLSYSRLSRAEIELKPIKLLAVVEQSIEQLKPEIAKTQAKIDLKIEPSSTMMGNQTILVQIISNLLSNAIKFVPSAVRPQICIRTEYIGDSSTNLSKGNTRLWIEDNGIGINPEHQKRIFQVFERLHGNEAYPGTGIGLAIVKKGIERIGGKFGVASKLEKGSQFWIEGQRE